jgi:hypothetical protein
MLLADEVVDWSGLVEVLWVSAAAGLAVTIAASLAILGVTRALEARRENHVVPAGLFSLVGLAGMLLLVGAIVFGVIVMATKK